MSRGKVLDLLRPDEAGKLQVACSTEVFGEVRALAPFRLPGGNRDYLALTSDSGRLVILEYDRAGGGWNKLHQETYGKSGARRAVPGQYLAADPRGRAVMVAALERTRLVYTLNRDSDSALTISSPLEAHKSQTVTFAVAGLDVGYDNPVFAAIELDCGPSDADPSGAAAAAAQKQLAFYELDLGLNHVVRAGCAPIDNGANLLVPVPGGPDGPGGVLVCAENWVIWRGRGAGAPEVKALLPRRAGLPPSRGTLIVAAATHKQKALFFALLQSEYGDIYKVTLTGSGGSAAGPGLAGATGVADLAVQVFDTLPPSVSLCVLKTGFLFAASDAGNHGLYQFIGIGDDDPDAVVATASGLIETDAGFAPLAFTPVSPPRNLALVDDLDSLAPLLSLQAANLGGEEVPQLYAACGRGPRSSLRVLRPGLAVTEMAASPLPAAPTAVFTLRKAPGDATDAFIVISFANATLVLAVGETVEEVGDTGFNPGVPTLRAQAMADGSFLQIHPGGLRHIRPGGRPPAEWRPPGRRAISRATSNDRQAALALAGGELVLFELGPDGSLAEVEKRDLGGEVASLDVPPVPEGRARARFLAVGAYDATIRLLSLDPESPLKVLAVQAAGATPESLLLVDSPAAAVGGVPAGGAAAAGGEAAGAGALFLHAGLATGALLRAEVDPVTGALSDSRTRFLGTRPPRLAPATVRGGRALLALSSRPWLGYSARGRHNLAPLACAPLDAAAAFASPQCPEGVCAVAGSTLLILALDRLGSGSSFTQAAARLRYTPRRLVLDAESGALITAEGDIGAVPLEEAVAPPLDGANGTGAPPPPPPPPRGPELDEAAAAVAEQVGAPRGGAGQWAACVRILDAASLATRCVLELDGNEAPTSMCLVTFKATPTPTGGGSAVPPPPAAGSDAFGQPLLAVGTAADLAFRPRRATEGYIRLYRLLDGGRGGLALVHKTALGGIPGALTPFQGRLLAGVGPALRLLDLGRRKLLRKCEYRSLPTHCVHLAAAGDRVYACDAAESAHFLAYRPADNAFYAFADDTVPRHIAAALPLDYDTLATGDKFGNLAVLRLPAAVSAAVEADPTGGRFAAAAGVGGGAAPPPAVAGAPNKVEAAVNFHAGDAITGLTRAVLQPGGPEIIVYGTLGGGVAAAVPLATRSDVDFFARLEMHLRAASPPLAGRDHLAYRSHYVPVRNAVDGDLCEQFAGLGHEAQRAVAAELDRTPGEVLRKLEAMRNVVGQ